MYFMFMLQFYLIYMLVIIMMCILLGHVRYVPLMSSLHIDVYVIAIIRHDSVLDVCVLMMLYNVNCVLLDDHDHDDVSKFECVF